MSALNGDIDLLYLHGCIGKGWRQLEIVNRQPPWLLMLIKYVWIKRGGKVKENERDKRCASENVSSPNNPRSLLHHLGGKHIFFSQHKRNVIPQMPA